jgi:hypothetical protein
VPDAIVASHRYWQEQLEEAVPKARTQGAIWGDIGTCLGMTRRAAHKRFKNERAHSWRPFSALLKTAAVIEASSED